MSPCGLWCINCCTLCHWNNGADSTIIFRSSLYHAPVLCAQQLAHCTIPQSLVLCSIDITHYAQSVCVQLSVLTRYYTPFVYKSFLLFCTNSQQRYIYLQFKVAHSSVFSRSTNLESKLIEFFVFVNFSNTVCFGSLKPFTVRKIGHFVSALASNNQFKIKLVKMWPGETLHVVVRTLKISLDQLKKKNNKKKTKMSLVECCSSCE